MNSPTTIVIADPYPRLMSPITVLKIASPASIEPIGGAPDDSAYWTSKTWSERMTWTRHAAATTGAIAGRVTYRNDWRLEAPSSFAARRTSVRTRRRAARKMIARSGIARHVTATTMATIVPNASRITTGGRPSWVSRYVTTPVRGSNISLHRIPSAIGAIAQGRRRTTARAPANRPRPSISIAVARASGTARAEVRIAKPRVSGRVPRNPESAANLTA